MYSLKNKYKRAIVTGGAGFVGSHLVESLLDDGLEVVSVDDYSAGKKSNVQQFLSNPKFREFDCDITDADKLAGAFDGVDIVFHEAVSKMTVCLKDPRRDLEINAQGTFNILELCRTFGVKKLVHASTGSVYGEAQYYPTNEKHPVNPTSYYGVSKLAGEKYVRLFSEMHGLDATILRYYHVYGPRQENSEVGGVVSIFARRAMEGLPITIFGDGTQLRSFTYVGDVVNINKFVASTGGTQGEAYNCASGIRVTIQELAEQIIDALGAKDIPIEYKDWKPGDIRIFDVDNSKLRNLGFNFETEFEAGLRHTLKWTTEFLKAKKNV